MAGDWIKMRVDLVDDPSVIWMSEQLGLPEPCVIGYLHTIWSWASRQCNDGSVTGVSLQSLERITHCENVPELMVKVGWLEVLKVDGRPCLRFPKWERHNSQSAKQRGLTQLRVAKARVKTCNDESVTKTLPEKRREEKRRDKKKPLPLLIPEEINDPKFLSAWSDWQQYRREKKCPLTETSIKKQLEQFASWGVDRSVAAIEHTVRKGWQGLREPEGPNGKPIVNQGDADTAEIFRRMDERKQKAKTDGQQ